MIKTRDVKHGLSIEQVYKISEAVFVNSVLYRRLCNEWCSKPTTARPLLSDGGNNRINAFLSCILLLICSLTSWLFKKKWQQTFCLTRCRIWHLLPRHQLSHDIQTCNQGHKIAVIYTLHKFLYIYIYISWQIIMIAGSTCVLLTIKSQLNRNFKHTRWLNRNVINESRYF